MAPPQPIIDSRNNNGDGQINHARNVSSFSETAPSVTPTRIPRYNNTGRANNHYQSTDKAVQTSAIVVSPDQMTPLTYPTSVWGQKQPQHMEQLQSDNSNNRRSYNHADDFEILYTQSSSDLRSPKHTWIPNQSVQPHTISSAASVDGVNNRIISQERLTRRRIDGSPVSKSCLTLRPSSSRSSDKNSNKKGTASNTAAGDPTVPTKTKNRFGWVMSSGSSNRNKGVTKGETRSVSAAGSTRTSQASSSQVADDDFDEGRQANNRNGNQFNANMIREEAEEDLVEIDDDDSDSHFQQHNQALNDQSDATWAEVSLLSPLSQTSSTHQRPSTSPRTSKHFDKQQVQKQVASPSNRSAQSPTKSQNKKPTDYKRIQVNTTKKQQLQQKAATKLPITATTSRQETMDLFTLPPVRDRGRDPKRIMQFEEEKRSKMTQPHQRARGLYDGEIEPIGVRGQQAKVSRAKESKGGNMIKMMPSSLFSRNNKVKQETHSTVLGMSSAADNSMPGTTNSTFLLASQSSTTAALSIPPPSKSQLTIISPIRTSSPSPDKSPISVSSFHGQQENDGLHQQVYPGHQHKEKPSTDLQNELNNVGQPIVTSTAVSTNRVVTPTTTDARTLRRNRVAKGTRSNGEIVSAVTPQTIDKAYSDGSETSTCSDDDIRGMLSDLLPTQEDSIDPYEAISFDDHANGGGRNVLSRTVQVVEDKGLGEPALRSPTFPKSNISPIRASSTPDQYKAHSLSVSTAETFSHTDTRRSNVGGSSRQDVATTTGSKNFPKNGVVQGSLIDKKSSTCTSTTTESTTTTSPEMSLLSSPVNVDNQELLQQVDMLNGLAVKHVQSGQYTEAINVFTEVLMIHQKIHGNGPHPNTASSYHNLGTVHAKRAQSLDSDTVGLSETEIDEQQRRARASALHCFQAAARSARDSLGKNHPNVAVSLVRIGFLLLQAKQYENAETTFSESLRIRLAHYGPRHALVANLHNNLGVCRMHLGKFETGLMSLEEALKIQRSILYDATVTDTGRNTDASDHSMVVNVLELADTLFNIGGLCLEWIRRTQGRRGSTDSEDYEYDAGQRAKHAVHVFEEALEIRLAAYHNNRGHPAVLQIQNLLIMAKQYELQHQQIQVAKLQQMNEVGSQRTSTNGSGKISTLATSVPSLTKTNNTGATAKRNRYDETEASALSNQSVSPLVPTAHAESKSIVRSTQSISNAGCPRSDDEEFKSSKKSINKDARVNVLPMENERDFSIFRGSLDKKVTTGSPQHQAQFVSMQGRAAEVSSSMKSRSSFPFGEVTMSKDVDDEPTPKGTAASSTRIIMSPHPIPKTSPKVVNTSGSDVSVYNSYSLALDNFSPDVSRENAVFSFNDTELHDYDDNVDDKKCEKPLLEAFSLRSCSYDAEENCLISNTGFDSEHGRIHYPLLRKSENGSIYAGFLAPIGSNSYDDADNNASDKPTSEFLSGSNQRDIIVAQPYREVHSRKVSTKVSRKLPEEQHLMLASSSSASTSTNNWGSETVNFSTGNKQRDEIMSRARAILDLHKLRYSRVDEDNDDSSNSTTSSSVSPSDDKQPQQTGVVDAENDRSAKLVTSSLPGSIGNDWLEDVITPLVDWGTSTRNNNSTSKPLEIKDLLKDPMTCLPDIQEEASKRLKENNVVDAIYLFEIVLRCQRRRFGALHPNVASSLHNVGIAQLRAENHTEALQAFEEAARVRKGSLGKDHPLVAVSLVKVGITLLLLHRFEEALWSFREALTVRKNSLGPLHPSTARIYNNIGCVYVEFNEFRQARRAFEAALDTQRSALVNDPKNGPLLFGTATTLCNLGYLYRFRDMHEKAAVVLREAVELQESVLGKSHATVLSTLDNLADSCSHYGNGSEALKYYTMVLHRFRVNSSNSTSTSNMKVLRAESVLHYKMSRVHRMRNDRENQLTSLQQALRALRSYNNNPQQPTSPKSKIVPSGGNVAVTNGSAGDNAASIETTSTTTYQHHQPILTSLEKRILSDIRTCREILEKEQLKWI